MPFQNVISGNELLDCTQSKCKFVGDEGTFETLFKGEGIVVIDRDETPTKMKFIRKSQGNFAL